jgi:hypothetical protein
MVRVGKVKIIAINLGAASAGSDWAAALKRLKKGSQGFSGVPADDLLLAW